MSDFARSPGRPGCPGEVGGAGGSGGILESLVEFTEAEAEAALLGLLEGMAGGEDNCGEGKRKELRGALLEGGVPGEPRDFSFREEDHVLITASLENIGIVGEGERPVLEPCGGGRCTPISLDSFRRWGTGNEKLGRSSFGVGTIIHSSAEEAVSGR